MMASAFDCVTPENAAYITTRLLAGDRMGDIRNRYPFCGSITAREMRKMRDEVFAPLVTNPGAVKALADGPMLNALEIVHYSHSRRAVERTLAEQQEMFAK